MMAVKHQHVRHGFGSVRPYIHGPVSLLDFVQDVFGAAELERHEFGPDSSHVEVRIGDSALVIEAGELPSEIPGWTNSVYVYVEDCRCGPRASRTGRRYGNCAA